MLIKYGNVFLFDCQYDDKTELWKNNFTNDYVLRGLKASTFHSCVFVQLIEFISILSVRITWLQSSGPEFHISTVLYMSLYQWQQMFETTRNSITHRMYWKNDADKNKCIFSPDLMSYIEKDILLYP